jgi:hypothetical protein
MPGTALAGRLFGGAQAGDRRVPWYRKMRRCGQININARDPQVLDIDPWLDYWFNADHQGRRGDTPIWDCAQQGRVAQSVMKGGTITNVTGSYSTTRPFWRHTSKSPPEATIWMAQTTASGMVPWYHWLGGTPQDLRWRETGRRFYQWLAAQEPHFVNRRSIANLGVVFAQRTNAFYNPPGKGHVTEFLQGLYYALLEGRFFFDFVHEDDLEPDTLKKYKALLLPNVALLSDNQCRQLRDYVQAGGSLLATFETGRYNEYGKRRSRPGLAEVFGIEPAVVISEHRRSRRVYFSGDVDRSSWRSSNTDLSLLLQNSVRWLLRNESPVTVTGEGIAELFAWETEPGFAVHILNYNNPNMLRGWLRRNYPIAAQRVRMELPQGVEISKVRALRAGLELSHKQSGTVVEFTVPKIEDYEVAALIRS